MKLLDIPNIRFYRDLKVNLKILYSDFVPHNFLNKQGVNPIKKIWSIPGWKLHIDGKLKFSVNVNVFGQIRKINAAEINCINLFNEMVLKDDYDLFQEIMEKDGWTDAEKEQFFRTTGVI
jgi:hypothetical protein